MLSPSVRLRAPVAQRPCCRQAARKQAAPPLRSRVRARSQTGDVDPTTGQPYANPQVRTPKPELSVTTGGLKWAYRKASPPDDNATKAPVLMLHGIGSHSFCFRDLMRLLSEQGHDVYAPDWPGHGDSDKPASGFAYTADAYVDALEAFTQELGLADAPLNVVTHGFVLGQFGMLWALKHATTIEHLAVLSVPLGKKAALRPELAAYKSRLPFLRPKPDAKFAGDLFNAAGLAYVITYDTAQVYDLPYQEGGAASAAIYKTMEALDWKALLATVSDGFCGWRVPSAVLYGNADSLVDVRDAIDFLDTKRTTMKLTSIEGKLGHMPQEDFADALAPVLLTAFSGGDVSVKGTKKFRKKDYEEEGYYEAETGNYVN